MPTNPGFSSSGTGARVLKVPGKTTVKAEPKPKPKTTSPFDDPFEARTGTFSSETALPVGQLKRAYELGYKSALNRFKVVLN